MPNQPPFLVTLISIRICLDALDAVIFTGTSGNLFDYLRTPIIEKVSIELGHQGRENM
jgi:hypothetical protein